MIKSLWKRYQHYLYAGYTYYELPNVAFGVLLISTAFYVITCMSISLVAWLAFGTIFLPIPEYVFQFTLALFGFAALVALVDNGIRIIFLDISDGDVDIGNIVRDRITLIDKSDMIAPPTAFKMFAFNFFLDWMHYLTIVMSVFIILAVGVMLVKLFAMPLILLGFIIVMALVALRYVAKKVYRLKKSVTQHIADPNAHKN